MDFFSVEATITTYNDYYINNIKYHESEVVSMFLDDDYHLVLAHNLDRVTIDIDDLSLDDDYGPPTPTPRTKVKRAKASWDVKAKTAQKTTPARHLRPLSTTPKATPPWREGRHLRPLSTTPKATPPRHLRATTIPKTIEPRAFDTEAGAGATYAGVTGKTGRRGVASRNSHRTRLERANKAISGIEMTLRARINRSWRKIRMEID